MEKLKILPLPEQLYRESKQKNVGKIELKFKRDRDETFLDIFFRGEDNRSLDADETYELYTKFENWAWRAYNYKDVEVAAFPGIYTELHGISVHYCLVYKRAHLSSWVTETERVDGPVNEVCDLEVEGVEEVEGVDYEINRSKLEKLRRKVQDISSYVNVISDELKEIFEGINSFTEDNNERD